MSSEVDQGDSSADPKTELPDENASRPGSAVKSKLKGATPRQTRLIHLSIKVAFAAVLTALLVYWGFAYQYDVVWFEF